MKRWFLVFILSLPVAAFAEPVSVPYHETKTILIPGATAAFPINSDYVAASAKQGVVTLYGKAPGTTSVIVVTASGTQSFEVVVPVPPPVYPPGFEMPLPANAANEYGSYEVRYISNPNQLQNNLDFIERQGDRTTHFFLGNANFLSSEPGVSTVSFPLAYYEISTPRKAVTFLDQFSTVSPLTVYDTLLRGIHVRDGGWFFHYGYTSLSVFENLLLPTGRQAVVGGGFKYSLSDHAKLIPSFFDFGNAKNGPGEAQPGAVGSLLFEDKPSDELSYSAELGFSRGVGASGRLSYSNQQTNLVADFHYEPRKFATLVTNNLHGFYSTANGFHDFTKKLRADFYYTGNRYVFPQLRENNVASSLDLSDQITKHWSVTGGAAYSYFNTLHSTLPSVRSVNLPLGVTFSTSRFGNDFLYQHSINGGESTGGNEFRDALHVSWRHVFWSGFLDRQTEAPSINFIFQQVPGLALAFEQLGLTATTPQQIAQLLQNDTGLISLGFVQGATVNLNPLRLQAGSDLTWVEPGGHQQQVNLNFLYSSFQTVSSTLQSAIQSASYSRKLTPTNSLWASYSLFRTHSPGTASSFQSQVEISLRHQFYFVPRLLIPAKHGTISGVVFSDDKAEGAFHAGMKGLSGVDVSLDGVQHTRSDSVGLYAFHHVPYGPHTVEVHFKSSRPFFYTTPSQATVEVNSTVNFGVGYSLSEIFGSVLSDAGTGIGGVRVEVTGQGKAVSMSTDMDGAFKFAGMVPGKYVVRANPESFPPGYAIAPLKPQTALAASNSPARVTFKVSAYRSIAGRVRIYDRSAMREVPVPGLTVRLKGTSLSSKTDRAGAYIFRNLPAGKYTVSTWFRGHEFTRTVNLPPAPAFPRDINLDLGAVDKFNPAMLKQAPARPAPQVTPKKTTSRGTPAIPARGASAFTSPATSVVPSSSEELFHKHIKDALFDFNQWAARPDARVALRKDAAFLKDNPEVRFTIEGHGDDRGTLWVNQMIGLRRAETAKAFLVRRGVTPDRIATLSFGKTRPFCFNHTKRCRQRNRRAHFVYGQEKGSTSH